MIGKEPEEAKASVSKKSVSVRNARHPALAVFLRDRGGKKALATESDHLLGEHEVPSHKKRPT